MATENRKLYQNIAVKEAGALSIIGLAEASEKVESENKDLCKKVKEFEDNIIAKMSKSVLE